MTTYTTEPCMICGQTAQVEMTDAEVAAYARGEKVQDVLPHWTPEQRELLISGTHPACWDEAFGEDEDD